MSSINDLATAASALVNNPTTAAATAPHPTLPDSAPTQQAQADDDRGTSEHGRPGEPASSSSVARGALVVLEGLDRSGKTTQVKLLEQRFVELGRKVKVMRFPGTSKEPNIRTKKPSAYSALDLGAEGGVDGRRGERKKRIGTRDGGIEKVGGGVVVGV